MMARSVPAPPSLSGRHILVVEDDYFIAEEMVRDLEDAGAVVLGPIPDVENALRRIEAGAPIDGAILDINLRGEMVYPVADALMKRSIPLVFATGYERWSVPQPYAGMKHCEKPVDPRKLAAALFGGG